MLSVVRTSNSRQKADDSDAVARPNDSPRETRILVVDDDPANLLSMRAALEGMGYAVATAVSGTAAMRRLMTEDYAVILLDVCMPGIDGFETAALIRSHARFRLTPIIFVTAMSKNDAAIRRGYEIGALDYLFKPVDTHLLQAKVGGLVAIAEERAKAEAAATRLRATAARLASEAAAREAAETELRRVNETLEARVVERTLDLKKAYEDLERFSYSVAHDLRAPLRAIAGFSRVIAEDHGNILPAEAQRHLERVERAARHMGQLIDDLLSFARCTRQTIVKCPVAPKQIVERVLATLESDLGERQIDLRVGDLPECQADSATLEQVFANLLSNAIKFTRNTPAAVVEIGAQNGPEGTPPVYYVRDNGAGFDMRYVDRLFGVFQRLHTAEEYEGTGIGLALVHSIIERHGGRIWAVGKPDHGATFYFTLG